jgi:hypothetical protein
MAKKVDIGKEQLIKERRKKRPGRHSKKHKVTYRGQGKK